MFGIGGATSPSPFQMSLANTNGFHDFHHQGRGIRAHEETQQHFTNSITWKTFISDMRKEKLIDEVSERQTVSEIQHWKKVLCGILDAVVFLAKNNLAFRGKSTSIDAQDCGNFLSLIKLLSNYYPPLATHLNQLQKHKTSYLSPQIQNEFIGLCGNFVRDEILKEIRASKYFTIMFDSTPDSSKKEQISQVIRIVKCGADGCQIREFFIDFVASEENQELEWQMSSLRN